MTRLALPGKCGGFTAMASPADAARRRGPLARPGARPGPARPGPARSVAGGTGGSGGRAGGRAWDSSPSSIDEHQLVGHEQHLGQLLPGRRAGAPAGRRSRGPRPRSAPGVRGRARGSPAPRGTGRCSGPRGSRRRSRSCRRPSTSIGSTSSSTFALWTVADFRTPVAAGDDPAADAVAGRDLVGRGRPDRHGRRPGGRPAADRGVLEVVARVPALGRELDPAERGVGPFRAASPGRPVEVGERVEARRRGPRRVDRAVAVAPGQGLRGGRRSRLLGGRVEEGQRRADLRLGRARAGRPRDRGGGPASAGSAVRHAGGQGLRPAGEERVVQREEGLLRDRRLAPRGDVQVGVGEVEDPEHARQELAIDQPVERPADVGRRRPGTARPPGRRPGGPARPRRPAACRGPPRRSAAGGSSARAGGSRGRSRRACSRVRGVLGAVGAVADRRPRAGSAGAAPWCSSPRRPGGGPASRAVRDGSAARPGGRSRWACGPAPRRSGASRPG